MRPLIIVLAFLAAGCGALPGQGAGASPTPTTNPMHFDVTATQKDHSVSMRVGQRLEVVLMGGGQINYQQVRSSDPSILQSVVDPAATAARGVTLAAFVARSMGQATVTAVGSPVCPGGAICPAYAILYSLTVTVTQ